MFVVQNQFLALNAIDFSELDLHKLGKHTFVLKAPHKTDRQGIVFKFQRCHVPQQGDVIHVTLLEDDESRVGFDRQVVAIQRKSPNYELEMDFPPELQLDMDDDGYISGCAIRHEDNEKTVLNQHSLVW